MRAEDRLIPPIQIHTDPRPTPHNVQPIETWCTWFSWFSACCCLCPPRALANYPKENITSIFSHTLAHVKIDLLAAQKNERELTNLGFNAGQYNQAICHKPSTDQLFQVTYAGHASLSIKLGEKYILIDPTRGKVSDYERKIPDFFTDDFLASTTIAAILVSHNHDDHRNVCESPLVKSTQPNIITGTHSTWPAELGYKNVHTVGWGQRKIVTLDADTKITITGVPAEHASARKGKGCCGCVPTGVFNRELWLGFFLEIQFKENGVDKQCNLYFTGDTGEGKYFQDNQGNTVTLQDYVISLATQIGGLDFIFAQVGPHEAFGERGDSPMHMGPSELVTFASGVVSALANTNNRVPGIVPVHHSAFAYEEPRGSDLLGFLYRAYQNPVLKQQILPLAIGGSLNLGVLPSQADMQTALTTAVASMYSSNSVFHSQGIRDFFKLPKQLAIDESAAQRATSRSTPWINFTA